MNSGRRQGLDGEDEYMREARRDSSTMRRGAISITGLYRATTAPRKKLDADIRIASVSPWPLLILYSGAIFTRALGLSRRSIASLKFFQPGRRFLSADGGGALKRDDFSPGNISHQPA